MLLQTNSYIVPKDKRAEHARLLRRFRASLAKLGCDSFEVYEQVGSNWSSGEPTGRYVQIMRFRDRRHQLAVQAAERTDPVAQAIIAEFCQLINFPYQQQQGLFAVGFYNSVLPVAPSRTDTAAASAAPAEENVAGSEVEGAADEGDTEPGPEAASLEGDGSYAEEAPAEDREEPSGADSADSEEHAVAKIDTVAAAASDESEAAEPSPVEASSSDPGGDPLAEDFSEPPAEEPLAPAESNHDTEPAEDVAAPDGAAPPDHAAPPDDPDELGALLDAHMHAAEAGESRRDAGHPVAEEAAADEGGDSLGPLDLSDLELPEESAPHQPHAVKHAAR